MHADAIAIIGMACRFPGAQNLDEYWDLLHEGQSHCRPVPERRFRTTGHDRSGPKTIYYGNFLDDVESFNRRFFHKTAREAATMDPQQRQLLETSHQALESAGYFRSSSSAGERDIGCFIGVCASDYNDNIANHPPNAFSTLGSLRAFLSGRISHFQGWSGPSMTIDTACSSSAVAINAACRALQQGDCKEALAGPVKPFDARADGYCRGEGVGLVLLKRLAAAIEAGDRIRGVILASAVSQSASEVPITVPSKASQTALYDRILGMSEIRPDQVSYVEAHGTGTRVGDVVEFEGIKQAFGSKSRHNKLYFATVKGNIGHSEGASGVASLIKTVLMMERRVIVQQANFKDIHPKIDAESWNLAIPTQSIPWHSKHRIACINNYGASGSIAAMVVSDWIPASTGRISTQPSRSPFWLAAKSEESLKLYARRLFKFLKKHDAQVSAADVAFHLTEASNRQLTYSIISITAGPEDFKSELKAIYSGARSVCSEPRDARRKPVIFVFGGQTSRYVGLSTAVFEGSTVLRGNLDDCEQILKTISSDRLSIYPAIFQVSPIDSITTLHVVRFALQYACARAWLDNGLHIDCVIGHSFGQIVAMAVSGVLSVEHALQFVYQRARLMEEMWAKPDRGAMIVVEADLMTTQRFVTQVRTQPALEVACYNATTSHVVVGSTAGIQDLAQALVEARVRYKILDISHGFHSHFSEVIMTQLHKVAKSLTFSKPQIALEACSAKAVASFDSTALAEHTRNPVYFSEAVRRVEARYGQSVWMATESRVVVVNMARRATTPTMMQSFISVSLNHDDGMEQVADATVALWKERLDQVQFWPFHRSQRQSYAQIDIPPYQFERERHWLSLDTSARVEASDLTRPHRSADGGKHRQGSNVAQLLTLLTNDEGTNGLERKRFRINLETEEWLRLVEGHAVLGNPLCPATLYLELVTQAARQLEQSPHKTHVACACATSPSVTSLTSTGTDSLRLDSLTISAPLCGIDGDAQVELHLQNTAPCTTLASWRFTFYTCHALANSGGSSLKHAEGCVSLLSSAQTTSELSRTEKLLTSRQIEHVLASENGEAMMGPLIYRVFEDIVTYEDYYKGVMRVVSRGDEVAATVRMPSEHSAWTDRLMSSPLAVDNFLQVAGIHVNCFRDPASDALYVCSHIDRMVLSPAIRRFSSLRQMPGLGQCERTPHTWLVYARSTPRGSTEFESDVYIFNATTKRLEAEISGARFNRVARSSLQKVLARAQSRPKEGTPIAKPSSLTIAVAKSTSPADGQAAVNSSHHTSRGWFDSQFLPHRNELELVNTELVAVLQALSDTPLEMTHHDVPLEMIGLDSLMVIELLSEIRPVFKVDLAEIDITLSTTISSLRDLICDVKSRAMEPVSRASQNESSKTMVNSPVPAIATVISSDVERESDYLAESRISSLLAASLDIPLPIDENDTLANLGMDSLLCMEIANDVETAFGIVIDTILFTDETTVADIRQLILRERNLDFVACSAQDATSQIPHAVQSEGLENQRSGDNTTDNQVRFPKVSHSKDSHLIFSRFLHSIDEYNQTSGFTHFFSKVFPDQTQLVLAYIVEAFRSFDTPLENLRVGDALPSLPVLPAFRRVELAMRDILNNTHLMQRTGRGYVRSAALVDIAASKEILANVLSKYPAYNLDHRLLDLCGSELHSLLCGKINPLRLLFGVPENSKLLADFYQLTPMYAAANGLAADFLKAFFE